ncbi:MAG TPA: hypothetical protein PLV13_08290, partial [Ilumatobacteraceae bacterium]|nr:hypothetical protein [Ilumatobacteraceae bacterium]
VMTGFVAEHTSQTALIDIHDLVCDGDDCTATAGGEEVRPDGLHFSGPGALTVAQVIMRQVIQEPIGGWPEVTPIDCC